MDTEKGPFTHIDADATGKKSWQRLLAMSVGIAMLNVMFCLTVRGASLPTFISHTAFLILAGGAQAFLFGAKFFSIERDKLRATTERRKAQIFGVSFRENFRFLSTRRALLSGWMLIRIGVITAGFLTAAHYHQELDLSGLVLIVGAMIAAAFLPEWLWAAVLTSAAFMIVETQFNRGVQNIVSLAAICLGGLEFLGFSWMLAHSLDETRFSRPVRRQDTRRLINLLAAFCGVAVLIFALTPKDEKKIPPRTRQTPKQAAVLKNQPLPAGAIQGRATTGSKGSGGAQQTGGPAAKSRLEPSQLGTTDGSAEGRGDGPRGAGQSAAAGQDAGKGGGGASQLPPSQGQLKLDAQTKTTHGEKPTTKSSEQSAEFHDSDSGTPSQSGGEPEQPDSTKAPSGKQAQVSDIKSVPKGAPHHQQGAGIGDGSANGPASPGSQPGASKSSAGKSGAGKSGNSTDPAYNKSEVKQTATKTLAQPKKQKPKRERLNLRPIFVVVLALLAIGFIALLATSLRKKRKAASAVKRRGEQLPDPITARQLLAEDVRAVMAQAADSDEARSQLVIALYNVLMSHYDRCGRPRPEHFTPDDFNRNEWTWRPATRNPLAFVTAVFNRTYYGKRVPGHQDVMSYQQAVMQIGQSLLKAL